MFTLEHEKKPLVSFIITYYNEPLELLRACIESVLALSLSEAERQIIVVDDGSQVSPIDHLSDLSNTFLYVRQANQGLSVARNTGIDLAKGNFIQFVDADDYLLTSAYEQCLDLVRYKDTDMVIFRSTHNPNSIPLPSATGPMGGTEFMAHNNIRASVCCCIFSREQMRDLRFTKGITHEDEEFMPLLMLRMEKVFTTENEAYFYRKRKDSIVHRKDRKWIMKRLADVEQIIYRLNEGVDYLPVQERKAMERRIAQLTMDHIYNVMRLTHDPTYLEHVVQRLTDRELFPLPNKGYTKKYTLFRTMTLTKMGRRMMLAALALKR